MIQAAHVAPVPSRCHANEPMGLNEPMTGETNVAGAKTIATHYTFDKANNIAQKELTAVYAQEIKWVKSVNNEIVVLDQPAKAATSENIDDASITSQVKFSLFSHESTSSRKTKVTTNEGAVVITGEAQSDAEKALVTKLAEDIRGVKSVSNKMTVKN